MAYQRLLAEVVPDLDLRDFQTESISDTEAKPIRSQIRDLSELLEKGVGVYSRDDRIYLRYHGVATFRIEINYQEQESPSPVPSDLDHHCSPEPSDIPLDNRIYLEGIEEFPVYLEATASNPARNQLANFWFSFVEHGLQDVLRVHQIELPSERAGTPDFLSGSV